MVCRILMFIYYTIPCSILFDIILYHAILYHTIKYVLYYTIAIIYQKAACRTPGQVEKDLSNSQVAKQQLEEASLSTAAAVLRIGRARITHGTN